MDPNFHNKPTTHNDKHQFSTSELMSNAKVVAEAAQATLHHETDKVDKGRVAGAAADLVGAVSHYGKLEGKEGFGEYVEKAENYLHQYSSTTTTTTTTSINTGSGQSTTHSTTNTTTTTTHPSTESNSEGDGDSESGFDGYFKMAQGFLKQD